MNPNAAWATVNKELLGVVSLVLFLAGIAAAFWLVFTEGLHAWILLAIAAMAVVGGAATSLDLVLTERRNHRKAGLTAEVREAAQCYSPAQRLTLLILSNTLVSFGIMLGAPIAAVATLCGVSRDCMIDLSNATAWLLFAVGVLSLLVAGWIYDEEKLGYRAVSRLRRKRKRREPQPSTASGPEVNAKASPQQSPPPLAGEG